MQNEENCRDNAGDAGVDINRNFETFWKQRGKCDDQYGGESPFSEPETRAVRDYINRIRRDFSLKAAIDVHSFAEVFFIPDNTTSAIRDKLINIGKLMAAAIKEVDSTADYEVETVPKFFKHYESCVPGATGVIGRAGGNSMDWFFHGAGNYFKILSLREAFKKRRSILG